MTSPDAARLARLIYDLWFDPVGHAHDAYPAVYVNVDGRYREVDRVTYHVVDNEIEIAVALDIDEIGW